MKMRELASSSMARTTRCMSSRHSEPVRILCASTRAREQSKRSSNASRDISSEKMPTTFPSTMAAFSAMFIANAVLPIEGRAARMTRSDFCKPLVISSRSL